MEGKFIFCIACYVIFFLILKMPMQIGKLIILIMFTNFVRRKKKRYSLAYQKLKHHIDCKMIKLIEFDEVKFYSVVLASMEWVNSLIYKPGIIFWHFRYMYVLFYWYADWNYCNFHIWHSRNFSMSSILKNTSSTQHSFFF